MGLHQGKGKQVPVDLYEMFSANPALLRERKRQTRQLFEEATKLFSVREFARARTAFENVLEDLPGDKASISYIRRCDGNMNRDLPDGWDGALNFDFK